MKRLISILAFTLLTCCALAQEEGVKPAVYKDYKSGTDTSGIPYRIRRDVVARYQINALKNGGVLLVRLKNNANTVNVLRQQGKADLAAQIEREALLENQQIADAFRDEFKFCPVYFFMSTYSDTVRHEKLDQVIFLNEHLQPDSSIKVNAPFFLIAEKGDIYNSSLDILPYSQAQKATESGTAVKQGAIVIKNKLFQQLHAPFPYYVKGYDLKKYYKYVISLNKKLQAYYQANQGFSNPNPKLQEYLY